MVTLEHVSKQLNTFSLSDISIALPSGYILGLIGENGAGKTTLLHLLAGLYSPDQGSIRLDGLSYPQQEALLKQQIGVVFHDDLFDLHSTLLQNASRYGRFYERYESSLLLDYLNQFQLDGRKKYGRLSKGEKLKFAMAFALSHNPRLLLLDEPTANFDQEFRTQFLELLRQYTANGENSVILATHLTSDIDRLADYLLFLKDGRQLLFGDIEQIRGDYRIVAGEEYQLRKLKERILHLETGEYGSKALIRRSGAPLADTLKIWEPSTEELMYFLSYSV